MTTLHAPKDLRFIALGDVEPGSIVDIVGRERDIPRAIRLRSIPETKKVPLLVLGGAHSFLNVQLDETKVAHVVAAAENVRVALDKFDPEKDSHVAGSITIHDRGAFITAKQHDGAFNGARFCMTEWGTHDPRFNFDDIRVYTAWKIGTVDERGDFTQLFERKPTP